MRNITLDSSRDVENALLLLMNALGICHSLPDGSVYVPRGCSVDDNEVRIGIGPGVVLIMFGDAHDLREADKGQMLKDFKEIEAAVLGDVDGGS